METMIEQAKQHCIKLLSESTEMVLPYHNLQHTLEVFNNVQLIGRHENISEVESEIVQIAALFHDTGMMDRCIGHEKISAENAKDFLEKSNYSKHKTEAVINCIMATKMPQSPQSKLECIICDADLFHLASSQFVVKNIWLRQEWAINLNITYTDEEWQHLNFNFLQNHSYFTSYCQSVLEDKKLHNCLLFQENID